MPSVDIASSVDLQTLDNAINIVKKEITTRYDFRGAHTEVDLDKKNYMVTLEAESEMHINQMQDILITKSMRQGLEANCYDLSRDMKSSGKLIKKDIPVKNGLGKEDAKKLVKVIKDSGIKVQAAIMDDIIRVTGKKIDDLQEVMRLCRNSGVDVPLQFTNMKS